MEVGRLCVKIAGRDAGLKCVVVEKLDEGYVMIDGQTRRRKCNLKHLEPLKTTVDIKKGASHTDVKKALENLNIEVRETKPKKATEKPKKQKKSKKTSDKKESSKPAKKDLPSRSEVESMTKDDVKAYAKKEFSIELSTDDLKDEMINQFFKELES